ncbi:sensor histidine kinase [Pseudomonas sp. LS1212]|uniref:sensor histidine kinase n=1 Tax=Pseudomonas sp. LS1212 TaxID=2972478 RepID=UPI002852780C|nr:sensor histidine kinase [Pseudomonas sp. LS1212]
MEPGRASAPTATFFLPQLCQPQALLVLVVLAELLVLVLELSQPMQPGFDWVRLGLTSLFVQWLVLLSAALLCGLRRWLARLSAGLAGTLCCALVIALTLACTAIADYFGVGAGNSDAGRAQRYLRHGLMSLIIASLLLRYFYLQSQWRRQEQAELHARLEALQARIKPHLLFNTLNSIASLVASDPGKAEQAVLDLSDLLRASLGKPTSLVLWKEEVALAKRYLSIEQYRLGKRLQLDWRINTIPDDLPIPQLTLQPLLENALVHGIAPRIDGGVVRVEADYKKGVFILCVSNPYDEAAVLQASSGTQQALLNIGARLAALFGPRASLSVDRRDGRHFTCLRYPCARPTQESSAI